MLEKTILSVILIFCHFKNFHTKIDVLILEMHKQFLFVGTFFENLSSSFIRTVILFIP